jgi:hypothetical protein
LILNKAINTVTDQIKVVDMNFNDPNEGLRWTGTKVQLVELVYPLRGVKCINNGEITLAKLFKVVGTMFNFEVKDYSRIFVDIKNRRTDNNTPFLDSLRREQKRLIEEANLRPPRK